MSCSPFVWEWGAAGKGFSKGKIFRGGSKRVRDGYINSKSKDFQRWFHRYYKDPGVYNPMILTHQTAQRK